VNGQRIVRPVFNQALFLKSARVARICAVPPLLFSSPLAVTTGVKRA